MNIKVGTISVFDAVGDEVEIPAVELTLSERNLRTLLATVTEENNAVTRFTEAGVMFIIKSEPNETHYAERPAGLMAEEVELKLAAEELGGDDVLYVPTDLDTMN